MYHFPSGIKLNLLIIIHIWLINRRKRPNRGIFHIRVSLNDTSLKYNPRSTSRTTVEGCVWNPQIVRLLHVAREGLRGIELVSSPQILFERRMRGGLRPKKFTKYFTSLQERGQLEL